VNAAAAVQLALTTAPTTSTSDTTPPTVSVSAPLAGSTVSGLVPVNVSASDNVGVTKVTLSVNGALYATSTNSPFGFSWDSTKLPNGSASLVAMAHDAAGNSASSSAVAFNVSNAVVSTSITPPTLTILSPTLSSLVGSSLTASSSATDNLGASAITQKLYVDSTLATTASGATLTYKINTRHWQSGTHTLTFVASDTAGNATTATRQVIK
jgi:thermitase